MKHSGTKTIKTERLTLRRFRATDFFYALTWYRKKELYRFSESRTKNNVIGTARFVLGKIIKYKNPDYYCWAITINNKIHGMIQVSPLRNKKDSFTLYYFLNPKLFSKGYMSEALIQVMEFMKNEGAQSIYSECDIDNIGSYKVMEKANMKRSSQIRKNRFKYPDGRISDGYFYEIKFN